MSAPTDKTVEEWAALCASQALIIQELVKEKRDMAHAVRNMKKVVAGSSELMEEQTAAYDAQTSAATALIESLIVVKKEYVVLVRKLGELTPDAQGAHTQQMLVEAEMHEHHFAGLLEAAKAKGGY